MGGRRGVPLELQGLKNNTAKGHLMSPHPTKEVYTVHHFPTPDLTTEGNSPELMRRPLTTSGEINKSHKGIDSEVQEQ